MSIVPFVSNAPREFLQDSASNYLQTVSRRYNLFSDDDPRTRSELASVNLEIIGRAIPPISKAWVVTGAGLGEVYVEVKLERLNHL